jgi:nicotinamidase-related amidase
MLLVIDVQEGYRSVLSGWDGVVAATALLARGAAILGVPVIVTEQYPRGLGRTAAEISAGLSSDVRVVEKMSMSCCGAPAFAEALRACERDQILIAGIEAHACVNQTVHDLLERRYQVHVARDATSSRRARDVGPAWEKMLAVGMLPTSSEQALLELVMTADAPEFKDLQRLLKQAPSS